MKGTEINRKGLYCKLYNHDCEICYILANTYDKCAGKTKCDCPNCKHSVAAADAGKGE